MISESALCLALQREKLNKAHHFTPVKGGVVTAASCMGLVLAKRLQKAGMTFELEK